MIQNSYDPPSTLFVEQLFINFVRMFITTTKTSNCMGSNLLDQIMVFRAFTNYDYLTIIILSDSLKSRELNQFITILLDLYYSIN